MNPKEAAHANAHRGRIERFIRQTLGCTCPDEVLSHIEAQQVPFGDDAGSALRIAVGGRLLVLIPAEKDPQRVVGLLQAWLCQGKVERDRLGMNRLRLVIAVDAPEAARALLEPRFRQLPEVDARTHLHVVTRDAVAGL